MSISGSVAPDLDENSVEEGLGGDAGNVPSDVVGIVDHEKFLGGRIAHHRFAAHKTRSVPESLEVAPQHLGQGAEQLAMQVGEQLVRCDPGSEGG